MLSEARRVLKPGGRLVIGFIDRESHLGRHYLDHQDESVFYREATFYSADEVETLLEEHGFGITSWAQTLARPLPETIEIEAVRPGRGECAFVVVAALNEKDGSANATPDGFGRDWGDPTVARGSFQGMSAYRLRAAFGLGAGCQLLIQMWPDSSINRRYQAGKENSWAL